MSDSSLDSIINAGVKADMTFRKNDGQSKLLRPWSKWIPKIRSNVTLHKLWRTSNILTGISLLSPLVVALPSLMASWIAMGLAMMGVVSYSISNGCRRFLNTINNQKSNNRLLSRFRKLGKHQNTGGLSHQPVMIMHDELSSSNWGIIQGLTMASILMTLIFMIVSNPLLLTWVMAGSVPVLGVIANVVSSNVGKRLGVELLDLIGETMDDADRRLTIIEEGDPSNALAEFVAFGDHDAMNVVSRYEEFEKRLLTLDQDLEIYRSKYRLAFESLCGVFSLRNEIRRRPKDYEMTVSQANELVEATTKSMIRSIDDDMRSVNTQHTNSVLAGANYVTNLGNDDLKASLPSE